MKETIRISVNGKTGEDCKSVVEQICSVVLPIDKVPHGVSYSQGASDYTANIYFNSSSPTSAFRYTIKAMAEEFRIVVSITIYPTASSSSSGVSFIIMTPTGNTYNGDFIVENNIGYRRFDFNKDGSWEITYFWQNIKGILMMIAGNPYFGVTSPISNEIILKPTPLSGILVTCPAMVGSLTFTDRLAYAGTLTIGSIIKTNGKTYLVYNATTLLELYDEVI